MRRIEAIEAIQGFARVSSNPYLLDWGAGQRLLSTMASGGALCESSGEGSEVMVGFQFGNRGFELASEGKRCRPSKRQLRCRDRRPKRHPDARSMHHVAHLHILGALIESGHKWNPGVERDGRSASFEGSSILRLSRARRKDQNDFAVLQNIDRGLDRT
jgi:hypothetical protein